MISLQITCAGCGECSRGRLLCCGDSLADRAAGCPGHWGPGCSGCRGRLARGGTAPLPPSPREAPGALSSRAAGTDASATVPTRYSLVTQKWFAQSAPGASAEAPAGAARSPGRSGAGVRGSHWRAAPRPAEPSPAEPHLAAPLVPPRARPRRL